MNEQGFHSRYAYDERGGLITYTNNICAYANKEMDKLLDAETNAATEDELQKATWKVQQKIDDEALWVPCWTTEFIRLLLALGQMAEQCNYAILPSRRI